jgi:hypothetical protein
MRNDKLNAGSRVAASTRMRASLKSAMNMHAPPRYATAILALLTSALVPSLATAQAAQAGMEAGKWQYGLSIYGWGPSIGGKTTFPVDSGASSIGVSHDQIISELKFAFMGSFDAHNGRSGAFIDFVYFDLGGSKSQSRDFSIGNAGIPAGTSADLSLDVKSSIWTIAGQYRVAADPAWKVDLLAGARLLDITENLSWTISGNLGSIAAASRSGSSEVSKSFWDAIFGVKGRYAFGAERKWSVPFYADIGTGQSERTTQAAAGIAYSFRWGELTAMWRYLDYKMRSGSNIQDVNLNGPLIGATWRW